MSRILLATASAAILMVSGSAFADEFDLKVNGKKIPREQLELLYKEGLQVEKDPAKLKQLIRQDTIRREVLAQKAEEEGLGKESEFRLRQEMSQRYALASAFMNNQMKGGVSDADAQKRYQELLKEAGQRTEYKVRHILVDDKAKAENIAKQAKANPKKFADLAKDSKDTGSAKNGGDLGWVGPGALVPEFEQAMVILKKGQVSDPVQTQYGYHVILVEDMRIANPPKFEEIKDRLKAQIARERADKLVQELVEKAKVE